VNKVFVTTPPPTPKEKKFASHPLCLEKKGEGNCECSISSGNFREKLQKLAFTALTSLFTSSPNISPSRTAHKEG
jgi:hypothetical protein